MNSIAYNTYASIGYKDCGKANQLADTIFTNFDRACTNGFTKVRALYPCIRAGNSFIKKLDSHVKEAMEIKDCVDRREAGMIKRAQAVKGLFRDRGY